MSFIIKTLMREIEGETKIGISSQFHGLKELILLKKCTYHPK
jgi:hypothetical protein